MSQARNTASSVGGQSALLPIISIQTRIEGKLQKANRFYAGGDFDHARQMIGEIRALLDELEVRLSRP